MKFVSFRAEGRASFGIVRADGGIFDLGARIGWVLPDLKSLLQARSLGLAPTLPDAETADYAAGDVSYLPVIPNPGKIMCVGLNYEEHRKETGRPESAYPAIFTRFADTLVGHDEAILLPPLSSALDYEGELAVVIGRDGFRVAEGEAMSLVAGYSCFNDATLRDWQRHNSQFTPGKNFPSTGGFGPHLVTADEVGALGDQKIETRLAGTVMQSARLGDMTFPVQRIVAYLSSFTRLRAGDVIATGTPGGVGFKREPQRFMTAGETVEVSIEGVGVLRNLVAADTARA